MWNVMSNSYLTTFNSTVSGNYAAQLTVYHPDAPTTTQVSCTECFIVAIL